jgi:endogenous inhibitor of DNA gyrase (YacG/DUF329 family)
MKEEYIIDTQGKKRKATEVICDFCGKSFLKQTRLLEERNYCSKKCVFNARKNRIKVKCALCGTEFEIKKSRFNNSDSKLFFCCRKCKDTFGMKEETKEKLSIISTTNNKKGYYNNPRYCEICGKIIPYECRDNKTCCKECSIELRVKNKSYENCGGYREGSSRGKHGYYKGIRCDSTYELAYLIYCLDHNIDIKRCDESFEYELNGVKHLYHPDFIVGGTIVEIKNYYREENDIKLNAINKDKKILYYKDLIPYFEYVSKTYNKKYRKRWNNFYELYENKK